jgi:anhydro-N-acetylmuramic acid kinase
MRVAGLISGTSLDGIDVAIIDLDEAIKPVACATIPYPEAVRREIFSVTDTVAHTGTVSRLNVLLGELFAQALIDTCNSSKVPLDSIQLIGSHGQTIFHEGQPRPYFGFSVASTFQIGEANIIAERTGIPTVSDFRRADMAAGGQGAPLVPLLDYRLFCDPQRMRVALNLGGIANITVIPAHATLEDVLAFDTGPSNMVLDNLARQRLRQPCDTNGSEARKGAVNISLLDELLADPYFKLTGPKSAGREQYGEDFLARFSELSAQDALATATELTVRTVAGAIHRFSGDKDVIAAGGGVHNIYLMERLAAELRQPVLTTASWGIPIDAKEAIAFAYLAALNVNRSASNIPSVTGAHKAVVLGKLANPFPNERFSTQQFVVSHEGTV